MSDSYSVEVSDDKAGVRLDKWLADSVEDLSRARLQALLAEGAVCLGEDCALSPKRKVKTGEVYAIQIPEPTPAEPEPQNIPLDVLYEDDAIIVIDKPPGLVVHPAAGNADGTLVNALLYHCGPSLKGIGGVARPGIVHRLDKGTGGVMIAAKTDVAHVNLSKQFASHDLERAYYAVVWGIPTPVSGMLTGNIGRSPNNRKKMALVERGGKSAVTHYRVVRAFGSTASLVECRLETGRTHQIRVHMASLGCPIIGDPVYGGGGRGHLKHLSDQAKQGVKALNHQVLYAFLLTIQHPISGEVLRFEKDKSQYIRDLINLLENT